MTAFAWGVGSHVGRVRAVNQDRAFADDGFYVVADGMGGHAAGEVAAAIAVETLADELPLTSLDDLVTAVEIVNSRILEEAATDPSLNGMGTTLVALARVDVDGSNRLALVNVGDSRAYIFSAGTLEQLTDDHSLVAALVRDGRLSAGDAERHPQKNVLTRALGVEPGVEVDAWEVEPALGDRYVLCTDGLTNELTEDQIAGVLRRLAAPQDAADELVRLAVAAGGRDNVTAVVVDVVDAQELAGGRRTARRAAPTGSTQATGSNAATEAALVGAGVAPDALAATPSRRGANAFPAGATDSASDSASSAATSSSDTSTSRRGAGHRRREKKEPRPPLITWRVVVFGVALLALLAGAIGAVQWYGTHAYYVGASSRGDVQVVTLYKGRSGGVLWVDPSIVEQTTTAVSELTDAQRLEVGNETSRTEARARALLSSLTTPSTTTTVPTTTTLPTTTTATTATTATTTTTAASSTSAAVTAAPTTAAPTGG
jgi:serine/threonine protein phosphatase PrpC